MNVILAGLIGSISAIAGFISESTFQSSLMLSDDAMRWVSISFIMMLGIILPLAVFLAEKFGYKLLFFYGLIVFLLGSFLNCIATGFISLILSRLVAGAGAGALFPLSIAIIDQVFPKKQVATALALYVGIVFGLGGGVGFFVGGYFSEYLTWQSPFLLCFLAGLPVLPMTWIFHEDTQPKQYMKFDTPGYLTFIVFITSILLILVSGKAEWNIEGWRSPFLIVCYVLAILSLLMLVLIELKSKHPLVAFSLFKKRSFLLGCMAIFFIGGSLYTTMQLAVTFLDIDLKYAKHTQGFYLSTLGLTMGITSACTAFLSKRIEARFLALLGMGLITLSCWMNPSISIYSDHTQFLLIWNLRMLGIGLALGPATAFALSDIRPEDAGASSVFITLFRQVGGTIGTLCAGVIVIQRKVFHGEIFGSQVHLSSPATQSTVSHLKHHLIYHTGTLPEESEIKALTLIRENLLTQSHAVSINDAFYLIGWATFICFFILLIEYMWSSYALKKPSF